MKSDILIADRLELLGIRKTQMISYLRMKVGEEDWHGVADAAMDLRDIENEIIGMRWVIDPNP